MCVANLSFLWNGICLNYAKSLIIAHKSNNICKEYDFAIEEGFLLNLTIPPYNVTKPLEDSFKTI